MATARAEKAPKPAPAAVASNKPLRTPDEWGMLAIKVTKEVQDSEAPDGRRIRKTLLECPELDDCVLMSKNVDYETTNSNGEVTYHSRPEKRVFIPKKEVEAKKKKGYEVVDPQVDWRVFAFKD